MRIFRALLTTAAVAGTLLGTTVTADAAVTTPWRMTYGATLAAGSISWGDGRSATVSGSLHAVSGTREVCSWGVNGTDTSPVKCTRAVAGTNATISHGHTIDKVGGVQLIYINLSAGTTDLHQLACTRSGCTQQY